MQEFRDQRLFFFKLFFINYFKIHLLKKHFSYPHQSKTAQNKHRTNQQTDIFNQHNPQILYIIHQTFITTISNMLFTPNLSKVSLSLASKKPRPPPNVPSGICARVSQTFELRRRRPPRDQGIQSPGSSSWIRDVAKLAQQQRAAARDYTGLSAVYDHRSNSANNQRRANVCVCVFVCF